MVTFEKPIAGVSGQALTRFARQARRAAGVRGKVNVTVTSSRRLRALNRRYRGQDKPTDVLSFPAVAAVAQQFAGDIVISADIAARQARQYGHDTAQELKILILHGMLHLAGLDHETDSGAMGRREERLRRALHLRDGLIARVAQTPVAHAPSRVRASRRRKR